jgi:hypothetical protein
MRPITDCGQRQHAATVANDPAAHKSLTHLNESKYSRFSRFSKLNWTGQGSALRNTCAPLEREVPNRPAEAAAPAVPLALQQLVGGYILLRLRELLLRLARGPPRHPSDHQTHHTKSST